MVLYKLFKSVTIIEIIYNQIVFIVTYYLLVVIYHIHILTDKLL